MSIMHRERVEQAIREWRTDFTIAAGESSTDYLDLVRMLDSDGLIRKKNLYWIAEDPFVREDSGMRDNTTAQVFNVEVSSKRYRGGFTVDADEWLEADVAELHRERVRNLGRRPGITKNRIVMDALLRGNTAQYGLAFDGVEMFSASHPGKSLAGAATTYSNLTTDQLDPDAFDSMVSTMQTYTDAEGELYGNEWRMIEGRPTVQLLVGPTLQSTALEIVKAERNANGATNIFAGTAEVKVSSHLTGAFANYWFVRFRMPGKEPIAMYEPYEPTLIDVMDPTSKSVYDLHSYKFGVNFRFGVAYWAWPQIAMSTGAGA